MSQYKVILERMKAARRGGGCRLHLDLLSSDKVESIAEMLILSNSHDFDCT